MIEPRDAYLYPSSMFTRAERQDEFDEEEGPVDPDLIDQGYDEENDELIDEEAEEDEM